MPLRMYPEAMVPSRYETCTAGSIHAQQECDVTRNEWQLQHVSRGLPDSGFAKPHLLLFSFVRHGSWTDAISSRQLLF